MAKVRKTELDIDIVSTPEKEEITAEKPKEIKHVEVITPRIHPNKKRIIIGIVSLSALLILTVIGFTVNYFFGEKKIAKEEVIIKEKPPVELNLFITTLAPFFIPIADEKGEDRFLKVALGLEMTSNELTREITKNLLIIRENIYLLLIEKKIASIRSVKEREKLASEIKNIINMVLQKGKINKIYFVELVVV